MNALKVLSRYTGTVSTNTFAYSVHDHHHSEAAFESANLESLVCATLICYARPEKI
jgi:hypothetical protein